MWHTGQPFDQYWPIYQLQKSCKQTADSWKLFYHDSHQNLGELRQKFRHLKSFELTLVNHLINIDPFINCKRLCKQTADSWKFSKTISHWNLWEVIKIFELIWSLVSWLKECVTHWSAIWSIVAHLSIVSNCVTKQLTDERFLSQQLILWELIKNTYPKSQKFLEQKRRSVWHTGQPFYQ